MTKRARDVVADPLLADIVQDVMSKRARSLAIDPLLLDPAQVLERLKAPDTELRQTRALVVQVKECLEKRFHPARGLYEGGSLKKGTALRGKFDADLVLFINDFDSRRMDDYKESCRTALADKFGNGATFRLHETPYCLRVVLSDCKIDLQITGDPNDNRFANPERAYRAASGAELDKEVMDAIQKERLLLNLILLTKYWKKQFPGTTKLGCTSYEIELICMHEVRSSGVLSGRELASRFKAVLEGLSSEAGIKVSICKGTEFHVCSKEIRKYAKDTYSDLEFGSLH